jgi:hypothetical protein
LEYGTVGSGGGGNGTTVAGGAGGIYGAGGGGGFSAAGAGALGLIVISYTTPGIGALYAWGLNSSGQLGDGTVVNKSSPVKIGTSSWTVVSATSGSNDSFAITI